MTPAFVEWEALHDEVNLVVCPTCQLPKEQQAIDEEPMERIFANRDGNVPSCVVCEIGNEE
jgi:hypothetical protein